MLSVKGSKQFVVVSCSSSSLYNNYQNANILEVIYQTRKSVFDHISKHCEES